MGDSEAQFVGEVLTDELPSDLFDVSVVPQRHRPDPPRVLQLGDQRAQEIARATPTRS